MRNYSGSRARKNIFKNVVHVYTSDICMIWDTQKQLRPAVP